MNAGKFTAGPWRSEYPVVYAASGAELLHIDEHDCATVYDARLIAAAPELLEALMGVLAAQLVDETDYRSTAERQADANRAARAAIAKATGCAS